MAIRVAIFEDNKLIRESFEAILNGTDGFVCTGVFPDGNNLVLDIKRSLPDIVLMDIEMSGVSGIEATKIITQKFPDIKILIQTVFDDDEKIFAAICAGAAGYILKKTSPAKLIEAIQEVNAGGSAMSPGVANKVLHLFQQFAPVQNAVIREDEQLSKREKEILSLMMEGNNFPVVAEKLFVSYETVRTHVRSIYKKLHVASVNQALAKAFRQRLIK